MGSRGVSSKSSASNSITKMSYDELNKMTSKELEKFVNVQGSKETLKALASLRTSNMLETYNTNLSNIKHAHSILASRLIENSGYRDKYHKKRAFDKGYWRYQAQVKDGSQNAYIVDGNKVIHHTGIARDPTKGITEFKTAKEAVEFVNQKIKKYGVA